MKKRIISCLVICALVVLALVSCGADAKTFEGKTYTFDKIDVRLNSSLSKDAKAAAARDIKKTYGDEKASIKEALKFYEEELSADLCRVSYKFEKDGWGTFTFEPADDDVVTWDFKYEVHSKDGYLVLWKVDNEGERAGADQVFEIKGKKLIKQSSSSNTVIKTTFTAEK